MKQRMNYYDDVLPRIERNMGVAVQESDGSDPFVIHFSGHLGTDLPVMKSIVNAGKTPVAILGGKR